MLGSGNGGPIGGTSLTMAESELRVSILGGFGGGADGGYLAILGDDVVAMF